MDMLSTPPYAALVEGTRTAEPGGLAKCFPRCGCRRLKDDIAETLAEWDRSLADCRIEA